MFLGSLLRSASPPPPTPGEQQQSQDPIDLAAANKSRSGNQADTTTSAANMKLLPDRLRERAMAGVSGKMPELPTSSGTKQTIQARHGTATFVPKGHTIKVINTYGKQVVGFWGFALHAPPTKDEWEEDNQEEHEGGEGEGEGEDEGDDEGEDEDGAQKEPNKKEEKKQLEDVEEQEDAEGQSEQQKAEDSDETPKAKSQQTPKSKPQQTPKGQPKEKQEEEKEPDGEVADPKQEQSEETETDTAVNDTEEEDDKEEKQPEVNEDKELPSADETLNRVDDKLARISSEEQNGKSPKSEQGKQAKNKKDEKVEQKEEGQHTEGQKHQEQTQKEDQEQTPPTSETSTKGKSAMKGWSSYIPSVRGRGKQPASTEKASEKAPERDQESAQDGSADKGQTESSGLSPQTASKGWGAYIPSWPGSKKSGQQEKADSPTEERTWGSYIPSGQGFSTYLPDKSTRQKAFSSFTSMHQRDPSKSVAEQLYDFSKTPVGAAGLGVATGSGYASSLYAAYTAYNTISSRSQPGMEFLSMPHTRTSTKHLSPTVEDVLVSNLRVPMLTLVEDSGDCVHDTLVAACDPNEYRELGASKWEEHGSCAENLVLALQQLNQQVGLKANKAIGGDVTVNRVPSPLNLFMNVQTNDKGEIDFEPPKNKKGAFVKFRAERDVVIVMSACPQDITDINNKRPMVAHFLVEEPSEEDLKSADKNDAKAQQVLRQPRNAPGKQKQTQQGGLQSLQQSAQRPSVSSRRNTNRAPPRKLDRIPTSRKSSSQMSVPMKESQRVEPSDPPTPRAAPARAPAPEPAPEPSRTPSRPAPRPGRNKPRKLERRTANATPARG